MTKKSFIKTEFRKSQPLFLFNYPIQLHIKYTNKYIMVSWVLAVLPQGKHNVDIKITHSTPEFGV